MIKWMTDENIENKGTKKEAEGKKANMIKNRLNNRKFWTMLPTEEFDNERKPKLFSLAGYNSQPEIKNDIISKIQSLGGQVSVKGTWDGAGHYRINRTKENYPNIQIIK